METKNYHMLINKTSPFGELDIYHVTDQEFRDMITKRRLKNGKITEEEAFLELI